MTGGLARRLLQTLVVAALVAFIAFFLIHLVPGDPARTALGTRATPQAVAALHAELGLDKPVVEQFGDYLANVARGDLGTSLVQREETVTGLLMPALGVTMSLVALTVVLSVLGGTAAGLWATLSRRRVVSEATNGGATLLIAMPPFFVGLLLLWIAGLELGLAPAGGWAGAWPGNLEYLWLPSIALSAYLGPLVYRTVQESSSEVVSQDFVDAAHARGISSRRIALRHVLPNSLLPVITLVAINFGTLVGGAVVVETVFNLPGIGAAIVNAVSQRDYPVIQGAALIAAIIVVLGNLIADLLYAYVDPRTRVVHGS